MKSITWNGNSLILLDQTKLPNREEYIDCTDWRQVAEAIKKLRVRGHRPSGWPPVTVLFWLPVRPLNRHLMK